MRLIRPAHPAHDRRWALALSLGMLLVGTVAILVMALLPGERLSAVAALGVASALALGVGLAWLIRALADGRRPVGDDLARLLGRVFDESYVLIVAPRLPGVSDDLAALLVGPPGVRAVVARRWRGRYRVRGRGWEYDTRSRSGWIACRTNPSFDADAVADAVSRWARGATDDPALAAIPVVAFPHGASAVVLEEPDGEVVTSDNAPWWAQRIGRVQRMDAARVGRFVQAVLDAAESGHGRRAAVAAATPASR
ncbi:MAG TPA: hypothetical protein VHK63_05625 [Candidatus Limnocylindria bacterium]|nr:hypothetical protein [Candidatus Limnocylindria bacterium]